MAEKEQEQGPEQEEYHSKSFGWALKQLEAGRAVNRRGWKEPDEYILLWKPDEHYSRMTLPCLYIKTTEGDAVPWTPSQADMLSIDWITVAG